MSKEYHVFTHIENNHQQAFVFEVERHDTEHFIKLNELWLVTTQGTSEVRSRVQFDLMVQSIAEHTGGNIDDNGLDVVIDMFKDVLPEEKKRELLQERLVKEEIQLRNMNPEDLIVASEYAMMVESDEQLNKDDEQSQTD